MPGLAVTYASPELPSGLAAQVERLAPGDLPIVITGPIGVGKTHLARLIHDRSKRAGNFIPVPLTSLQQGFEHVTLAGHDKGSYTGADRKRGGLLAEANHGTLFLDEIGDASVEGQRLLLELLTEKGLRRLGEERRVRYDLRFILATHVDLDEATSQGRFREDLLSRLGHCWVNLLPLRERPGDIAGLILHYIGRFTAEAGQPTLTLSTELLTTLERAPWLYNVRSLVNECQALVAWQPTDRVLRTEHLSGRFWVEVSRHLQTLGERERLELALILTDGLRAKAATLLSIDERTLYRKTANREDLRTDRSRSPERRRLPGAT